MVKINRNDRCPCGSGKKYKQCCLKCAENTTLVDRPKGSTKNDSSIAKTLLVALEHHQAGRLAQAESIYQEVLLIKPDHPEALHLSGVLAHHCGKNILAVELISRAINAAPSNASYHYNIAMAHMALNNFDEAIANYKRAIALKPDFVDAHNNLGNIFRKLGKLDEAVSCYRKALVIKPDYPLSLNNIGAILKDQFKFAEAIACYQQALTIKANYPDALLNLGNAYKDQGKLAEAITCYRDALTLEPGNNRAHSNLLFILNYASGFRSDEIYDEHCRYGETFEEPLRGSWLDHGNNRETGRRLRIGYVSGDFRKHAVAYFLEPVLLRHNHEHFEIFCYSNNCVEDEVTVRLKGHADWWRSIQNLTDDHVAQLIREDEIDILVDLAGHSADNRLLVFARRPSPVQVTWLGYLSTTGLQSMNYRIVDHYTDPEGMSEKHHTETLCRMPDSFAVYQPPAESPAVGTLPALSKGHVTFGSFNNFAKVTASVIALWTEVLKAVPGSQLMLKTAGLEDTGQRDRLLNAFAAHGIGEERLLLLGRDGTPQEHLAQYGELDIALDPFPCNGGTTTCDSLWMGVPVVSLAGDRFISRMGVSMACNSGLAEWVAQTPEEYVSIARLWAGDLPGLAQLRAGLREQIAISPLFDAQRFTLNLEAAYREMWGRLCANP